MRATIGGAPDAKKEEPAAPQEVQGPVPPIWIACGVLVAAGIIGAVAIASGKRHAAFEMAGPASSIPGFPNAVDPSALVTMARNEARLGGDARLVGIRVTYVGSNGRVNLRGQGYDGRIAYSFIEVLKDQPAPSSSAPLGAPQPMKPSPRTSTVSVTSTGTSFEPMILIMTDEPVPDPQCTVEQVWAAAHAAGAPNEAIAVLSYGMKHVFDRSSFVNKPRWDFSIEGTRFKYEIDDPSCQVVDPSSAFKVGGTPSR
jgi:hypothetical protein